MDHSCVGIALAVLQGSSHAHKCRDHAPYFAFSPAGQGLHLLFTLFINLFINYVNCVYLLLFYYYFIIIKKQLKTLIIKYFRHSHSSGVQPSELVQGGFKVNGNIGMYMEKSKPSQSGVGHCRSKWSLAPF